MKGIILAGGKATRLRPCTKVTSKQLLPVYDKPMIFYPLETLVKAGVKEILVIIAPENAGDFVRLLGSGKDWGVKISFEVQEKPGGLAQAFVIGEGFIGNDDVCLILGDNIFEDDFSEALKGFQSGGLIFAKEVKDPERYGVVEFDEGGQVISIEEKPEKPKSDFCIPGFYVFDKRVIEVAKKLEPSERGEVEITDVHRQFLEWGELRVEKVRGEWLDAGTFESFFEAQVLGRKWAREGK